ncbi:Hypothetical predicted protein [Cloeon dipterum]|uniref:Uncharacterized protein n=1 Tax=Cloeon dipterum TaxID=197152 RepID=A0A8S1DIA3_9INSE|nr:Hypothetical predicted protein [Cloeon dipterum]
MLPNSEDICSKRGKMFFQQVYISESLVDAFGTTHWMARFFVLLKQTSAFKVFLAARAFFLNLMMSPTS